MILLFLILLSSISIEAALITKLHPTKRVLNTLVRRPFNSWKDSAAPDNGKVSIEGSDPVTSIASYKTISALPAKFQHDTVGRTINYYLRDKDIMERLIKGPLPVHVLNDSDFFEGVVERGNHVLCSELLRNGQKVKLIDENGNNLIVRLIEKRMSYIIGTLVERRTSETLQAFGVKDAKTGHTPLSMAIKLGDQIAVYEIVSPRRTKDQ